MLQTHRFRLAFVGLVFMLGLLNQSAWADSATKAKTQPCESDTRTLAELLKSDQPWSKKVPKDFTIEQHVERYVTVDPTFAYGLPSQTNAAARKSGAGIGENYRETAECKAMAPDGTRWIVENTGGYALTYVLESAVLPEAVYDARSNAGNAAWKKCADEVLRKEKAGAIPYNSPTNCLEEAKKAEDKAEKDLNYGDK